MKDAAIEDLVQASEPWPKAGTSCPPNDRG